MAEAWLVDLPLVAVHATASTSAATRRVVIVRVERRGHAGWGEASPLPGYTPETVEDVWNALGSGTQLPPTGRAALEAAAADLAAKEDGVPLWRRLGGKAPAVLAGAVASIAEPGAVIDQVAAFVSDGYRHVKLKVEPGTARNVIAAVRDAFPDLSLGADANGSFPLGEDLRWVDEFGLAYLEQPYPTLQDHRRLRLDTPLCLDESIRSIDDARTAIGLRAADMFSVKPSLLGLAASVAIHDLAAEHGVPLRVGGVLETGVGRAHALAVATLPGFTVPGDLGASARYFDPDLIEPPWAHDATSGYFTLSSRSGIGVGVDAELLHEICEIPPLKFDSTSSR